MSRAALRSSKVSSVLKESLSIWEIIEHSWESDLNLNSKTRQLFEWFSLTGFGVYIIVIRECILNVGLFKIM